MPARKGVVSGEAMRTALVEAAGRLLHDEGPHALTTRRLADAVGTSTQAIYTAFGGKEGIVRAMYRRGFDLLAQRMHDAPVGDEPLVDLHALGTAYRSEAHANAHFYGVMFGRPVAEFTLGLDDALYGFGTLQVLAAAVQRCIDANLVRGDALDVAFHLWVCVHGFVSLELAGLLMEPPDTLDRRYAATLDASLTPFLVG